MNEKATILVVDDDEAGRYALTHCLRQAGHPVLEAATGREALRIAAERRPDLVLLDVRLPDLNGIEVCRQLKAGAATAHIPVIQASAYLTSSRHRIEGLESGADDYLTAPFDPREVLARVQAVLRVHRAEAALLRSEQRFRVLFDLNPDALFAVDSQGRFVLANPACETICGYPVGELLNKTFMELCAPDRLANTMRVFERGLRERISQQLETSLIASDGRRVELLITGSPLLEHGQVSAIYCTAKDITERLQKDRALRESEERFRALAQATFEGVAITEAGRFLDVNEQFLNLTGYSREEIIGMEVGALIPPEDRERVVRNIRAGRESRFEHLLAHKDGTRIIVEAHGRTADHFGRPLRFTAVRDVTAQKQAEQALRAQRELLAGIIDHIPVLLCIWDPNLWSFRFNKHLRDVLGWDDADAEGDFMAKAYPDPAYRQEVIRYMLSLEGGWRDFKTTTKDGAAIDISWANVRLSDGTSIGIGIDARERKRAEEQLKQAQAKLEAHARDLEKLVEQRTAKLSEMVSELQHVSYAITHDMRAPLRAMNGFAATLIEACESEINPAEAREYCRRIMIGARRLDQLITDSLSYTKAVLLELPLAPVNLAMLIPDILETYPNLHPEHADIRIAGELPTVIGNEALLTECFSNLLGNAVKFVAPGVRPDVRILVSAASSPELVRVAVEDNGIGIPKSAQHRLFGMFQKLDTQYEGTGIGLAIVRKVVERMDGKVGALSEPGRGSCFWVELRRAKDPLPTDTPDAVPKPATARVPGLTSQSES